MYAQGSRLITTYTGTSVDFFRTLLSSGRDITRMSDVFVLLSEATGYIRYLRFEFGCRIGPAGECEAGEKILKLLL